MASPSSRSTARRSSDASRTTTRRGNGLAKPGGVDAPSRNGEVQRFGTLRMVPIALSTEARAESCRLLNPILADSMILYALYKKMHWLVSGPTFLTPPAVRQARRGAVGVR